MLSCSLHLNDSIYDHGHGFFPIQKEMWLRRGKITGMYVRTYALSRGGRGGGLQVVFGPILRPTTTSDKLAVAWGKQKSQNDNEITCARNNQLRARTWKNKIHDT